MTDVTVADGHGRAATTGMWLFLASLVMFYGALFSGKRFCQPALINPDC